jgi:uncharacterized protein involved in exopolysaccharide biosynthesis
MNKPGSAFRELLTVLFARKFLLSAIFLAVVITGMSVTMLIEPTYESSMKLLVARDRIDPQVSAGDSKADMRAEISDEEFNSEMEILQSRQVLEAVVNELNLAQASDKKPSGWVAGLRSSVGNFYRSLHKQAEPPPMERVLNKISANLSVVPAKKSRIIKVSYTDSDPERAAQVLNTLYRKYADHHLKLHENSQAAQVFKNQTDEFGQKLSEATEALKRFDAQHGVTSVATQKDLLLKQFYDTQSLANTARTEILETEKRIATLKAQLETQPERIETEARTKYVTALDKMKEEVLKLELQRTELRQKYKPNERPVREIEERITQAKETLAREEKSPPQERAVMLNETHRRLMNELLSAQANLTALTEREKSLAATATQYQARIIELDQKGIEKSDLERTRTVTEDDYLLYRKKAREAEIINALNREKILNVNLADAASVNYKPVSPKLMTNLVVFIVIGLIAAMAGALLAERINPVVRSAESVRRQLGMEVLASIPEA